MGRGRRGGKVYSADCGLRLDCISLGLVAVVEMVVAEGREMGLRSSEGGLASNSHFNAI